MTFLPERSMRRHSFRSLRRVDGLPFVVKCSAKQDMVLFRTVSLLRKRKNKNHETQTGYDTFFQHLASIDKLVSS